MYDDYRVIIWGILYFGLYVELYCYFVFFGTGRCYIANLLLLGFRAFAWLDKISFWNLLRCVIGFRTFWEIESIFVGSIL